MDGQMRTNSSSSSSLLRSSPTVRSSIHSLSSVTHLEPDLQPDLEEQKPHNNPAGSVPVPSGSTRFVPVLALFSLSLYTLSRKDDVAVPENVLFALVLLSFALFFVARNKVTIIVNVTRFYSKLGFLLFLRKTQKPVEWYIGESAEKKPKNRTLTVNLTGLFAKFGFLRRTQKPVEWYIGETADKKAKNENELMVAREGVEIYSNGDSYEGEFNKGKSNGSGVYSYNVNKGRYEGDWVDGKYDGYGIEGWCRGSRYRGMYRYGLRHGFGVYRFYTGDTYAGEWCNGQSHGVGVQTCLDGSSFVGQFKLGVKHGIGCYHFRNGDRYAGEYFADKIHGFGIYHFANGHSYEGSWHEGRKQGYGMYIFRNGDTKCGEWDSGILKTPLPQLTDVVLRAVQAARKTAESAIYIKRVDEQVNKAVMAANRAATAARVAAIKAVQNRLDCKFCDIVSLKENA